MNEIMEAMTKNEKLWTDSRIIRLIYNDIVNTHPFQQLKIGSNLRYLDLYNSFDQRRIILEIMGLTEDHNEQGEIVAWYSEQLDIICNVFIDKSEAEILIKTANVYFGLKDRIPKMANS